MDLGFLVPSGEHRKAVSDENIISTKPGMKRRGFNEADHDLIHRIISPRVNYTNGTHTGHVFKKLMSK